MCSDMISNFYLGLLHIITKWTCMHFAIWFKLWDWRVTLPHVTRKSLRTPLLWLESASPSCKQKCFWDIGGALIGMEMQLQTGESQACQDQLLTVTHSAISDTGYTRQVSPWYKAIPKNITSLRPSVLSDAVRMTCSTWYGFTWLVVLIRILAWLTVKNTAFYKLHAAASLPHWFLYICMS